MAEQSSEAHQLETNKPNGHYAKSQTSETNDNIQENISVSDISKINHKTENDSSAKNETEIQLTHLEQSEVDLNKQSDIVNTDINGQFTESDDKGSELLFAVKNKKKLIAFKLLDEKADIHFVDETKCNVLHYAAIAGYDDLIIKLIDLGADVKTWDINGETPLHKASRAGHETTVVILVANGADIHALNWEGKNPLELAVLSKHIKIIETLCMFGADLLMQEWTGVEEAFNSKDKKDKALITVLKKQHDRLPGFQHGGISYSVKHVKTDKKCTMKHLGLTLKPSDLQTPFFFYCCKLQAEYTNFKQNIKEDQDLFSDVYECRTWGSSNKVHTLHFKMKGIPQCNETIDISSPDGKIGRVEGIERNEDENYTEITATVNLKHNVTTTLMFVTVEKPEVFAITKEAVHIQPQMEPDAEIDIPQDTFDTPGDLLLNVVETKGVNVEDTESQEEPVLVTNVIDLSMSNHQQPKRPIDMKLPMHSELDEDNEVVILSSSKEFPENMEDWEIIDGKKDNRRKCAAFQIRHFSIFTGVSKKKLDKDFKEVHKLIQKALNHERQVEFFILVQTLPGNEFAAVVECSLQRKSRKRKKYWQKKHYELQEETISHTIQINQWFKVQFAGNIKRVGSEQSDEDKMMFQPNRDNFKIFNLQWVNQKHPPIGRIKISLIEEIEQEPIRVVKNINCINCIKTKDLIPREPIIDYFDLTALPVELNPTSEEEPPKLSEPFFDPDHQCTIPVLKMPNLAQQLGNRLSFDEAHHLAIQLKVPNITELLDEYPKCEEFLDKVMWQWRGKRPFASQVEFLIKTLSGMGKQFEADTIQVANYEGLSVQFI